MKINRFALKTAVQKTLDNHEAQYNAQVKAYEDWLVSYRQEWVDTYNPQWAASADQIKRAVAKGEPITDAMLPHKNSSILTYHDPEVHYRVYGDRRPVKPPAEFTPSYELVALLEVLDLIVDDEVTPTGLQGLGITPKTLRDAILKLNTSAKIKA